MYRYFYKVMLAHPADVNESYTQHLLAATGFAVRLLLAAGACLVHALIPCLFTRAASRALDSLYRDVYQKRGAATEDTAKHPFLKWVSSGLSE